jgi:hypothetical protein
MISPPLVPMRIFPKPSYKDIILGLLELISFVN